MAAAHARTQIARRFFNVHNGIKNVRRKRCQRNAEGTGVFFKQRAVLVRVPGIHGQKNKFKRELAVTLHLLKELGHQHGVLAAGNTYGNLVVRLQQFISNDRFGKGSPKLIFEPPPFVQCGFNFRLQGCFAL